MKVQKQKISDTIAQIFKPGNYSLQNAHQKVNNSGGVISIVNQLQTSYRHGLSSNDILDHEKRKQQFGKNQAPFNQDILLKSVLQQRDFIINFLFYLLTLRICVKLILFRDELRNLHPLGNNIKFQLSIGAQIVSYMLLIGIIWLKAKVTVEYEQLDQDERKYKNEKIKVKRDGEKQIIEQKDLLVGDILIIEQSNQSIRIDGILLYSKNLIVSQAHTILRQDTKYKKQIWNPQLIQQYIYNSNSEIKDPFILAGSTVISGSGQILVLTVGCNCSFRRNTENKGYANQYTSNIAMLKKIMNNIQDFSKILTIILATLLSIKYLFDKYRDQRVDITWIDLLSILRVYCGFIGLICFVQRLKIIKSLQFYLESYRSNTYYRIKNKSTLEQLSKIQILFIQCNALKIKKKNQRQQNLRLQFIQQLSYLNNYTHIKFITTNTRIELQQIFGKDILSQCFFIPNQQISYNNHVKSLVQASFITETNSNTFINQYLPIYKALKYSVGYLYVTNNNLQCFKQIPNDILQINFQKLPQNQFQIQPNFVNGNIKSNNQTSNTNNINLSQFWLKIQNKIIMQDILVDLFHRSQIYQIMYNIYLALYVNNVLVFIIMCLFSTFVQIVSLSWFLVIIIMHRYLFFIVYKKITQIKKTTLNKTNQIFEILKLNLFLFPYYLFIASRFEYVSSLFLFFLVNGMLRIQVLVHTKIRIQRKQLAKIIVKYIGVYLIALISVFAIYWHDQQHIKEVILSIKYTGGLVIIYIGYVLLL